MNTADKIVYGILYAIGALIFYLLWRYGILTPDVIWSIVSGEAR